MRSVTLFECDHLHPIVRDDRGRWRHIRHDGALGAPCEATSVYRLVVTPADPDQLGHSTANFVTTPENVEEPT